MLWKDGLQKFPWTFFGFTNIASRFIEDQVAALCSIEESRLLLETYAPYLLIEGTEVSSPSQLWTAAAAVATHRRRAPVHVSQLTLAKGQHLNSNNQHWNMEGLLALQCSISITLLGLQFVE